MVSDMEPTAEDMACVATINTNMRTTMTRTPRMLSFVPFQSPFKCVYVMAAHMSGKSEEDNDVKPAADGKMVSNTKNSALCYTPKKENE